MSRVFHAPGKAVVLGEYAVVDGLPAIVAAVEHGVACEVCPAAARTIAVPGGDDRFVAAALDAAGALPAAWRFYDHPATGTATKAGLGGSAAATAVATFAALTLRGAEATPAATFALADRVHRAVQGSGSGVDVAASCWGGVLRFQRGEDPRPMRPVPFLLVWSGASARTGPRVQRYQAWADRAAFQRETAALVDLFPADPVAALRAGWRLLCSMAEAADLPYRTEALDRIVAVAEAHGCGAKPSGAGGGDCAVLVAADEGALQGARRALEQEGFPALATRLSAGVRELGPS